MNGIIDAPARAAAVDPTASFCVSAPAGSGKTELLVQRYLCLLSRVRRPEQILAITFTRKAAAEMRERVMNALLSARAGDPCISHHQQVTRGLAEQALIADERGGWHLERDISRLNIKTIDSFCAGLTRQMPVLSQLGGQSGVRDDASQLYAEAVFELYKLLDDNHPVAADLAALMLHFDNNWERLQDLLVSMLARREQWRGYVGVHYAPEESEAYLVAAVASLVKDELTELARLFAPDEAQLLELLQFTAANLSATVPGKFPGSAPGDLPGWRSLRTLLLTKDGSWRKALTKREGFPSGKGEPERRKHQMKAILRRLQKVDGLQSALMSTQIMPTIEAGSVSWQLVLHLSRLLPTLAAQLLLVFQKHGVVDHSQVAQSALLALGDDDAPTELALRLDYQIEHILVDEFQDTAITQYELLNKLTRGWGEYNVEYATAPRTLMIVGDGMQSIYGFRGANVGLFLKARREGFNGVSLTHLELRCNFRSDEGLVGWVNQTFMRAFPEQNDLNRTRVSYNPATAIRPPGNEQPVAMHAFHGDEARTQEVTFICRHIADFVDRGEETIAVLGRSRSHLQPIIKRLKQLNIAYNAPELDSLTQSDLVADLMTLCRALANDADRLAWMALLRAPWCGLRLADLLSVARAGDASPYSSVWSSLISAELRDALTEDGRTRLQHIIPTLIQARKKRDRLGLRVWVEQAWLGLGGPQCAYEVDGLHDAENFLQLLEQAEAEGVGLDINWLSLRLEKRYMSAGNPDSKVHLMTLHKAKGLEFDRVIIPQLDGLPRRDGREILLWDEHSNAEGDRSFFLAADDHSPDHAPTLYNYLRVQRQQKTLLEATRLLYVGATRAVSHLMLTASIGWDVGTGQPREPSRHSLLSPIWPTFEGQMTVHEPCSAQQSLPSMRPLRLLTRLVRGAGARIAAPSDTGPVQGDKSIGLRNDNPIERSVGRVVHLALEELSLRPTLPAVISDQDQRRWRVALQREGVWGEALHDALEQVLSSLTQMLRGDGRGRWVLSNEHGEAHSEWALTTVDLRGRVQDIIIDRSFIDRATGVRWVIEYKNSLPAPGESQDVFLAREKNNYLVQLRRYRDALGGWTKEPLRCALCFTALGYLHAVKELDLPGLES